MTKRNMAQLSTSRTTATANHVEESRLNPVIWKERVSAPVSR